MKFLSIALLLLLITGCSMFGIQFGTHRTVAIEKPPYRVVLSGDIKESDYKAAKTILDRLSHKRYRNHKFEPIKIEVYGSQATTKTDSLTLDVIKSQDKNKGE